MRLNELEIKIALDSEQHLQSIYQICLQTFGKPTSHLKQLDEYYDTPDRQLKQQDLVVRIRSLGDKQMIALKSPRTHLASGMTNRIELEFTSNDGENVQQQLTKQGLTAFDASEKERWTFVYEECEIVLDKLPFIGAFIEIEGPSEEAIQEMMKLLDLSTRKPIRKNYGELMIEKFEELKLPTDTICATFEKEKELIHPRS